MDSMKRDAILDLIRGDGEHIHELFGVKDLLLFGSVPPGDYRPGGDIDVLVEFDGPTTCLGILRLSEHFEGLVCHPVDLMTRKVLPARIFIEAEREGVSVA